VAADRPAPMRPPPPEGKGSAVPPAGVSKRPAGPAAPGRAGRGVPALVPWLARGWARPVSRVVAATSAVVAFGSDPNGGGDDAAHPVHHTAPGAGRRWRPSAPSMRPPSQEPCPPARCSVEAGPRRRQYQAPLTAESGPPAPPARLLRRPRGAGRRHPVPKPPPSAARRGPRRLTTEAPAGHPPPSLRPPPTQPPGPASRPPTQDPAALRRKPPVTVSHPADPGRSRGLLQSARITTSEVRKISPMRKDPSIIGSALLLVCSRSARISSSRWC